jgi:hypothetical protein
MPVARIVRSVPAAVPSCAAPQMCHGRKPPQNNGSKIIIPLFSDKSSDEPQYFVFWRFRQKNIALFGLKYLAPKIMPEALENHFRQKLLYNVVGRKTTT